MPQNAIPFTPAPCCSLLRFSHSDRARPEEPGSPPPNVALKIAAHEKSYPEWYDWTPYTWVFNAAKLPAASCPWGLDADGLPQAVQLIARHFREDLLLRASAVLEAAMLFPHPANALWQSPARNL